MWGHGGGIRPTLAALPIITRYWRGSAHGPHENGYTRSPSLPSVPVVRMGINKMYATMGHTGHGGRGVVSFDQWSWDGLLPQCADDSGYRGGVAPVYPV